MIRAAQWTKRSPCACPVPCLLDEGALPAYKQFLYSPSKSLEKQIHFKICCGSSMKEAHEGSIIFYNKISKRVAIFFERVGGAAGGRHPIKPKKSRGRICGPPMSAHELSEFSFPISPSSSRKLDFV
jgi:hypothetical protein